MNLDTLSFTVTAPGAGPTAMAAATGDVAVVRNGAKNSLILAAAIWTKAQAVGFTQILYPSGHDLVRGIRYRNIANQTDNKVPEGFAPRFRAQDPITVSQSGSATAGDVETVHMMMYYDDLPGVNGRLINLPELRRRGVDMLTVEDTCTATTGGQYGGQRTLSQAADLFKADTDYAVLGAVVGVACGALCIRGVDSGNLRCPIPGLVGDANLSANWFIRMSEAHDLPMIPIFNTANRAGVLIDVVQDENLTAVPFSLVLAELAPKS